MDLLKLHSITNKLIDRVDHIEKVQYQEAHSQLCFWIQRVQLKAPLGAVFRVTAGLTWKQC